MKEKNYRISLSDFSIRTERLSEISPASLSCINRDLLGDTICPYLLHSLIPYIKTLSSGGIFHWMLNTDPGGVIIQCPNPEGCLECILRRPDDSEKQQGRLQLTIRSVNGYCCYGHKPGQKINLFTYQKQAEDYYIFDVIFPWLVYGAASKKDFKIRLNFSLHLGKKWGVVQLEHKNQGVSIAGLSACSPGVEGEFVLKSCHLRCRYHKWPRRDKYKSDKLTMNELCPDFFHVVYPSALAKIYQTGLNFSDDPVSEEFICPQTKANIELKVSRRPKKTALLQLFFLRFLRRFGRCVDWPFYDIIMEITEGSRSCPRQHKTGQRFLMNLGFADSLCPAAFDAFYPLWHVSSRGESLESLWGSSVDTCQIQCPDVLSKNIYEWRKNHQETYGE